MAVAYNNQKVPTDGLVLYYDMHNPKSWKGEPTDNLFRRDSFLIGGVAPYSTHSGSGLGATEGGFEDPFGGSKAIKYTSGGTYLRYGATNGTNPDMPSGNTYTLSFYAKLVPGAAALTGASSDIVDRGTYSFLSLLTQDWQRFSYSALHDNNVNYAFIDMNINSGGEIFLSHPQLERRTYVTPYVFGERTTTQAILDLTKNGTITAADLTYSSENTFSFTKNTDRLSFPNPIVSSSPHTIIQWVRADPALPDQTHSNYRVTPMVGPSPTWNPGYWLTARVFRVHASTEYRDYTINWVSDTSWHMIGQVFDGTNVRHIIDGNVFLGTRTAYSPPAQTTIYIGAETVAGSAASWKGDLPAIMFYNRQLSDSEVRDAFEATRHRYGI